MIQLLAVNLEWEDIYWAIVSTDTARHRKSQRHETMTNHFLSPKYL